MKLLIVVFGFLGLTGCALGYLSNFPSLLVITFIGLVLNFVFLYMTRCLESIEGTIGGSMFFLSTTISMWATFFVRIKYLT